MPITYRGETFNDYMIRDTDGAIYSEKSKKFLKSTKSPDGYHHVDIYTNTGERRTVKVHLCTMHTYKAHPDWENMEVNHKKDKDHNGVKDLEWVTPRENIKHAMDTDLRGGTYLSDAKVRRVCVLIEKGNSNRVIAERIGLPIHVVHDIRRGRTYTHISKEYKIKGDE